MQFATPESVGISSEWIKEYIEKLEAAGLATHDLIIMRHGKVVFEGYWAPFNKDFLHRMYSVTKSFVSLAIGFLEQDGLINLDDRVAKYFPNETKNLTDDNFKKQTIRDMLMMATAKPTQSWFKAKTPDRVRFYFENDGEQSRPSGTIFQYDSTGSFVLGALVERVSGKTLNEYLREKLFDSIDVSKEAYFLTCPGGHSWGDSALLCTARDLLKTAKFCLDRGKVGEKQILNKEYVTAATSRQIDNNPSGLTRYDTFGYGYQFWMTYDGGFSFNGMGGQFAICVPQKDFIAVINADNQGDSLAHTVVFDNLFNMIIRRIDSESIEQEKSGYTKLMEYAKTLKLNCAKGASRSPLTSKINGVEFKCDKNPMGLEKLSFEFEDERGVLRYTNAQGEKELLLGLCKNEFCKFPQSNYSDLVGSQAGDRLYDCAVSAAWKDESTLYVNCQIIDTYFGRLHMTFSFKDEKTLGIYMTKTAEDFLDEYTGFATAFASE